jgi:hypothetical protein
MNIDNPIQQFNRFYRERRLEAETKKQSFPSYNHARSKLEWAVELAKRAKIIDPVQFWNFVFTPGKPTIKTNQNLLRKPNRKPRILGEKEKSQKREKENRHREQRRRLVIDRPRPENCEACREETVELVVDHCHKTGIFRGWLCPSCNTALGFCRDNPKILRRLADYVENGGLTGQKHNI